MRASLLALLLFSFSWNFVPAADTPAAPAPAATLPSHPALDPHVQALLSASTRYYAGLKSFEVDVTSSLHIETPLMKNDMGSSFHIAMQRPNSFALVMKAGMMGGDLISDGKTWITYLSMLNKYTSNDAPAQLSNLLALQNLTQVEGGLPLSLEAFLGDNPVKAFTADLQKSEYIGAEKIGALTAQHIRLTDKAGTVDLWLADGPQPLLLQSRTSLDSTFLSKSLQALSAQQRSRMPPGIDSMSMQRTSQFIDWKIDQPLAASMFQFQPPLGATLVDSFFHLPPNPLVGKMAPDFQLNDLNGHPVKLASLRGKVVVLDFWATWCGPCVASLPEVAAVTSSFKEKGVVFYAANVKETAAQIHQFQTDKSLSFPVLLDEKGTVSDLYLAKAIPETVLIDPAGKIEAVHVGYDPAMKKKLTQQLTDLLAGRDLTALASTTAAK